MTYWYTGVIETIKEIRNVFFNTPIILGGIYATLMPDHALHFSGADYVVAGEGENKTASVIEKAALCPSPKTANYKSLDDYPFPLFSLLNNVDSLPVLTSRGCPFKCRYCASSIIVPEFRRRNPQKVVDEIEYHCRRFGTSHFAFYDDALLVGTEGHFKIILREIIRRGITASFHMPNAVHGRYIDDETASLMYQAGCKTIRIGLETSDKERQHDSGDKISSNDFLHAVKALANAGYERKQIEAYVMMGLPGQGMQEVIDSIQFVNHSGVVVRLVSFTPIPNTPYWHDAVRISPALIDEPLLHNNSIYPLSGSGMEWEDFLKIKEITIALNDAL